MPKISKTARDTIMKIAQKNNMTEEEVVAYIDNLLRGEKVSKHFRVLT